MFLINYDINYGILFLLLGYLDRFSLAQLSQVCLYLYQVIKIYDPQKKNWNSFDKVAYYYETKVKPTIIINTNPANDYPIYMYHESIQEPGKWFCKKDVIKIFLSRSVTTKKCYDCDGSSCQHIIRHALSFYYIHQKDVINNFNEIIVPYICSGEFNYFNGIEDIYYEISKVFKNKIYFPKNKINSENELKWMYYHYMNVVDLIIWYYNRNPARFKNDYIKTDLFSITLQSLTPLDIYLFQSFSPEIQDLIKKGIINKNEDQIWEEVKNNFGHKIYAKVLKNLLNKTIIRNWVFKNFPGLIFKLVKSRQKQFLKLFLMDTQKITKIQNSKGQNLFEYSKSIKHGSPLNNIIQSLEKIFKKF